ncbi:MAG TPA: hypothetical protein VHP63_04685 [candidate division Zixibacteria bacterium]|nr:hypothetical protein [candidate division Zixibacteria bacterium]
MNMQKAIMAYAISLILLGVIGYYVTGMVSVTALIPTFFGLPIMVLAIAAKNPARRKHVMHIAVVLGLIGFIGGARGLGGFFTLIGGGEVARPGAVISQTIMAVLSLIFVLLCVKSFINARKNRQANQA